MPNNKEKNILFKKDFLTAVVMIAVSGLVKFGVDQIHVQESRVLPEVVFWIMLFCGILVLIKALKNNKQTILEKRLIVSKREMLGGVCLTVCWGLIPVLGFYTSLLLLMIAIGLVMEGKNTCMGSSVLRITISNALTVVFLWVCFSLLFHMVTPKGFFL